MAIDLQSSFFVRMKEAGDKAAKDYGVKTTCQSAEGSLEKQVSLIENLIRLTRAPYWSIRWTRTLLSTL